MDIIDAVRFTYHDNLGSFKVNVSLMLTCFSLKHKTNGYSMSPMNPQSSNKMRIKSRVVIYSFTPALHCKG